MQISEAEKLLIQVDFSIERADTTAIRLYRDDGSAGTIKHVVQAVTHLPVSPTEVGSLTSCRTAPVPFIHAYEQRWCGGGRWNRLSGPCQCVGVQSHAQ